MKTRYSSAIQHRLSGAVLSTILLLSVIWFLSDYLAFRKDMDELRGDFDRSRRRLIVDQVNRAVDYIDFQRSITRKRLRKELKTKVREAYKVAEYLYEKNRDSHTPEEISRIIHDTLFAIRWREGRGYYFAIDLAGRTRIHPVDPPGTDVYNLRDAEGHYLVRDFLQIVTTQKEGFSSYIWEKPPGSGILSLKLSYVKLFEPLGWLLGSGYYLDDARSDTQEIVKERINNIRFADGDGYVFAFDREGISLVNPSRPRIVGSNVLDLTDPNGIKIIRELADAGKKPGGGFVEYTWLKPGTGKYAPKISYAMFHDDWGWCVGSGVYLDGIDEIIEKKEAGLRARFLWKGSATLLILLILMYIAHLVTRTIARGGLMDFNAFTEFFRSAATHEKKIDPEKLQFLEFDQMAHAANRMIEKRIAVQNELSAHRERLEEIVAERTEDLERTNAMLKEEMEHRIKVEEMMIQSEKMLSLGGLAAGMAHEINNPLAGILQNAQVLEQRLSGDHPGNRRTAADCGISLENLEHYLRTRKITNLLDSILGSGKRAAQIVDNMLSFSRKSPSIFEPVELAELLERTLELAANDYNLKKRYDFRNIGIIREYDPSLPAVSCDRSKIQQVVLNLLKNGAQAMTDIPAPGEESHPPGPETPRLTLRLLKRGDMACIEIEDNGPGMDESTRKRVFDPFFTTKPAGGGTGLGLSISYFIISENHGGTLTVESAPGEGAVFTIQLPFERAPDGPADRKET